MNVIYTMGGFLVGAGTVGALTVNGDVGSITVIAGMIALVIAVMLGADEGK